METALPTMRVPEMNACLAFQVFGPRPTALPGDLAYTDRANTFTVSPQTITSDDDTHAALVLNAHSTSQTANIVEVRDAPGGNVRSRTKLRAFTGVPLAQLTLGDVALFDSVGAAALLGFGVTTGVIASAIVFQVYSADYGTSIAVRNDGTVFLANTTYYYGVNTDPGRYSVGTDSQQTAGGYFGLRLHGYNILVQYADTSPYSAVTLLPSSTTAGQPATEEISSWATNTHATRKARWVLGVHDAGTSPGAPREAIRAESDGSAARLGFFGSAAVAPPTGDVADALRTLGLMAAPAVYTRGFADTILASDAVTTSSTFATVTGFNLLVAAGDVWHLEFALLGTGGAAGMKFRLHGGGVLASILVFTLGNTSAVTSFSSDTQSAVDTATQAYLAGVTGVVVVRVTLTVTVGGTLNFQFASAVNTETNTILAGSYLAGRRVGG